MNGWPHHRWRSVHRGAEMAGARSSLDGQPHHGCSGTHRGRRAGRRSQLVRDVVMRRSHVRSRSGHGAVVRSAAWGSSHDQTSACRSRDRRDGAEVPHHPRLPAGLPDVRVGARRCCCCTASATAPRRGVPLMPAARRALHGDRPRPAGPRRVGQAPGRLLGRRLRQRHARPARRARHRAGHGRRPLARRRRGRPVRLPVPRAVRAAGAGGQRRRRPARSRPFLRLAAAPLAELALPLLQLPGRSARRRGRDRGRCG